MDVVFSGGGETEDRELNMGFAAELEGPARVPTLLRERRRLMVEWLRGT
jgi:hypothetical protein